MPEKEGKINQLIGALKQAGLHILSDGSVEGQSIGSSQEPEILAEEFLSEKIYLKSVGGLQDACDLINKYSGGHSAVIVTEDSVDAEYFLNQVDCAAVYHNVSSRFTDGSQFGFGAEIAISTQKLHFRGPLGLGQLVTNKWFVYGEGQVRP